ncbi:unnamed protein product [Sphenostylis stenocarpa]|uniref:Flavin-containing monooxygenase n=1 Tax=Sphenostylis stenocarpa TaxID=92480 RepID=A0AA86VA02_9FABA|nr:unnamed protein product [Sphenostylis stenocarpa]
MKRSEKVAVIGVFRALSRRVNSTKATMLSFSSKRRRRRKLGLRLANRVRPSLYGPEPRHDPQQRLRVPPNQPPQGAHMLQGLPFPEVRGRPEDVPGSVPRFEWREEEEWVVESLVRGSGSVSREVFEANVLCSGHNSTPRIAEIAGIELWRGFQMHSHNYRVPEPFRDQVLSR